MQVINKPSFGRFIYYNKNFLLQKQTFLQKQNIPIFPKNKHAWGRVKQSITPHLFV